MRRKIKLMHMENGVTMIDPERTYIEAGVKIGCEKKNKISHACNAGMFYDAVLVF